ncbi:hypothetical protein VCB98_01130 [Gammaproteobacteria bacterium AB-CW1]|uniref:Tetratricopeptide repeat protein n=1 Tax=Natronospira elongata TaxID=3110268 RepID=A0AAP6MKL8_9GAMM|nr:hypothetical protein [Gammaproteobacteria bacterium AB-CW1]
MLSTLLLLLSALSAPSCDYDHDAMMALDQNAFDQDMEGGWRTLHRAGCTEEAADLIRDYRRHHDNDAPILLFHEGQMRAQAGQTEKAIPLIEQTYRNDEDRGGWNFYVDGTIAFLEGDRKALKAARERLADVPEPEEFAPVDTLGNPVDMPWPPNLPMLDRLIDCFDSDYAEAYHGC